MRIGLGTYAFFWRGQHGGPAGDPEPMSLAGMIDTTADCGLDRFQICDYPPLSELDDAGIEALRRHADRRGVGLELGTRGTSVAHLDRFLQLARRLDAPLVRSMINSPDHRPTPAEAVDALQDALPAWEQAGVTLALETYEQVPTATLVEIVTAVGSPRLGICLDPGNCVAGLERPGEVIEATAALVRNVHVKDFDFSRRDGWVGFTFAGVPLGQGKLPLDTLLTAARNADRAADDISLIVEHWLPWQGDRATTVATEDHWTRHTVDQLRSQL